MTAVLSYTLSNSGRCNKVNARRPETGGISIHLNNASTNADAVLRMFLDSWHLLLSRRELYLVFGSNAVLIYIPMLQERRRIPREHLASQGVSEADG